MYNKGKQFETQLYMNILGALRGSSMIRLGLSCFPAILSPIICTCEIRKQSDKNLISLNPKYETQVNENFRAVRPHNRADKFIKREKNNHQFFIYGPQCEKNCILGYSGGPGWPINNQTGPILLPSYPLTYINLHI